MKSKVIITAGGTSERIDNVRKITNSSTGKLGCTIANEILSTLEDVEIYYICSKTSYRPDDERVHIIEIEGTTDLKLRIEELLTSDHIDYFIHSMAVSDYMTDYITTIQNIKDSVKEHVDIDEALSNVRVLNGPKISSYEDNLVIVLKPTPKIISLIKGLSPDTYLVGFKLLDKVSKEELIEVAKHLRDKNNCDLVVANDLDDIRNGVHQAYIIDKEDEIIEAEGKEDIAKRLVGRMIYER